MILVFSKFANWRFYVSSLNFLLITVEVVPLSKEGFRSLLFTYPLLFEVLLLEKN